jgi:5-methylcytosine-specific restriction endonuclease McrA
MLPTLTGHLIKPYLVGDTAMTHEQHNTPALIEKRCTQCGEIKPIDDFPKASASARSKTGIRSECKECKRQASRRYHQANRETVNARKREYDMTRKPIRQNRYQQNREEILARNREYASRNKEAAAARNRRYRQQNQETIQSRQSAYRQANHERLMEKHREWRKLNEAAQVAKRREYYLSIKDSHNRYSAEYYRNNPVRVNAIRAARRARELNAEGRYTQEDIEFLLVMQGKQCACCRESIATKYHVDHVVPLSAGGSNYRSNLQLLCPPCNLQKSSKHPIEFMQQRGFLL